MILYVFSSGTHLTSEKKLSIHELTQQGFNTSSTFQVFELIGDVELVGVQQGVALEEVHVLNYGFVSSTTLLAANSFSPHDILYGVRTKQGVRTNTRNETADHITCPCSKKAFKHIKLWDPVEQQVALYICSCGKKWVEQIEISNAKYDAPDRVHRTFVL